MVTKKTRRIRMMLLGAVLLAGSALLVSFAFRDAIVFFFSPTELLAEQRRPDQLLRVGGLVVTGSLVRGESETATFDITPEMADRQPMREGPDGTYSARYAFPAGVVGGPYTVTGRLSHSDAGDVVRQDPASLTVPLPSRRRRHAE